MSLSPQYSRILLLTVACLFSHPFCVRASTDAQTRFSSDEYLSYSVNVSLDPIGASKEDPVGIFVETVLFDSHPECTELHVEVEDIIDNFGDSRLALYDVYQTQYFTGTLTSNTLLDEIFIHPKPVDSLQLRFLLVCVSTDGAPSQLDPFPGFWNPSRQESSFSAL